MKRNLLLVGLLLLAISLPASANWTATGAFQYEDRDWNQTGFTGTLGSKPVRFADVEVIDPTKSGSKQILASGKTDASGAFSIAVVDSTTRSQVAVRVLTRTTKTSDLFVKVTNQSGSVYAGVSPSVTNHGPNANVAFGTLTAAAFSGAEAFNILDLGIYGADYIQYLTGSRPGSNRLVTFKWQINGGVGNSTTSGNTVSLRDSAGYDDTVILHEWAHYIMSNYSKVTNPGGTHYLSDCNEDLRLAFDEARASSFGCSVRRYFAMPLANVYVRTDGGSGPGHATNWYDLEDAQQYPCQGDTSEVSVSRSIWDIVDGVATQDFTAGTEDAQDLMSVDDKEIWQVYTGPVKNVTYVTDESFWDGWFDPTVANGYYNEMKANFSLYTIEFFRDAFEPNNVTADAKTIFSNGPPIHLTYFDDSNGDGKGEVDTDLFKVNAVSGVTYTIETLNLLSDANTNLELLDTNGSTVLASNNDRSTSDKSSLITWTAPRSDVFYVRSKHATGTFGTYGSYDLKVSNP